MTEERHSIFEIAYPSLGVFLVGMWLAESGPVVSLLGVLLAVLAVPATKNILLEPVWTGIVRSLIFVGSLLAGIVREVLLPEANVYQMVAVIPVGLALYINRDLYTVGLD